MKLKINNFGSSLNSTPFDFIITDLEELEFTKPLVVSGVYQKAKDAIIGDYYIVNGEYFGEVKVQCVRCLKDISQEITGEFQWKFLEPRNYSIYIKSFEQESEIDSTGYEEAQNGEIDLGEIVRQEILLDLDFYPTCKPFCEDDSEIEKYSGDIGDQRWAKLLEIKE